MPNKRRVRRALRLHGTFYGMRRGTHRASHGTSHGMHNTSHGMHPTWLFSWGIPWDFSSTMGLPTGSIGPSIEARGSSHGMHPAHQETHPMGLVTSHWRAHSKTRAKVDGIRHATSACSTIETQGRGPASSNLHLVEHYPMGLVVMLPKRLRPWESP